MTQTDIEPTLSFVTLSDDGHTLLLNGEEKYSDRLPMDLSRKKAADKQKIVETTIFNGCNSLGIFYVSEDNVRKLAKEIVNQLYERPRVAKNYVASLTHPILSTRYRNDYFEYLIDCISRTVKEESTLIRQITYTMLSAYGNDPINLGVLAPTSTGKSYPIIETAKFGPIGTDIRIVGSMSPKVLIREQGVLVDKDCKPIAKEVRRLKNALAEAKSKKGSKNSFAQVEELRDELAALLEGSAYLLDLSNKTLLFLEPPQPELMALLKPILSHDYWEMEHPFVDKIGNGGLEVKRVITRGWPACIFCSAKDESKWEVWSEIESRFMIVSPNMVKPKYQAGNRLIAQKNGLPSALQQRLIISDTEKELAKQAFLHLKHQIQQATATAVVNPVWIPYALILGDILPADRGQDNRAASRFYTMLKIVTMSKAHLRHKLIYGDEELVIATLEDLRETLHIMQNITGMPPHKHKFYQQYILLLYKVRRQSKLKTKDICDFYNANAPKGAPRLNSDNIRKTYIEELVNHSYLEQEQDEGTKAKQYVYTPLVDVFEEEDDEEEDGNNRSNRSKLGQFAQNLQYTRLLLPQNHEGIPEDWLNRQISLLSDDRITSTQSEKIAMRILDPKGNEILIEEDFIKSYEPSLETGLRLKDFFKVPSLVGHSKSVEIASSEDSKQDGNERITTDIDLEDKKWQNRSKVGHVGHHEEQEENHAQYPSSQVSPIDLERYKDGPEGEMQRERDIKLFKNMPLLKCPYPDCDFQNVWPETIEHHKKYKHITFTPDKEVSR